MPTQARGRRNRFFEAEGVDELLSMVLELTAELSVLRERQYATERVLEAVLAGKVDAGAAAAPTDIAAAIEAWEPTDEDGARLAGERERLLATVLRAIEADGQPAADADTDTETLGRSEPAGPEGEGGAPRRGASRVA